MVRHNISLKTIWSVQSTGQPQSGPCTIDNIPRILVLEELHAKTCKFSSHLVTSHRKGRSFIEAGNSMHIKIFPFLMDEFIFHRAPQQTHPTSPKPLPYLSLQSSPTFPPLSPPSPSSSSPFPSSSSPPPPPPSS